jgi:2-C-methyl-D-erythritol 4-phosphate cytidylyltransferase
MIRWSIDVLVRAGCSPIVVAVPANLLDHVRSLLPPNVVTVVAGGSSRQASVAAGLEHVSVERVLIHDASRPLITTDLVRRVVNGLSDGPAVIPALPIDETLKTVTNDRVVGTVLRSGLWRAQTPQAFDTEMLKRAHEKATAEGFEVTDDAQLIERYGGSVVVIRGDRRNLKVTYPEDFELVEALLEADG